MPQVLPLYIVVMLAHGTTEPVVVENLEAFLGEHSQAFTTWSVPRSGDLLLPAPNRSLKAQAEPWWTACGSLTRFLGHATRRLFQHMGEASKVEALKIASNAGVAPSSAAATPTAPAPGNAAAAAGNATQETLGSLATLKAAQAAPRCIFMIFSTVFAEHMLVKHAHHGR
jgi:hypothetical protein